MSDWYDGDSEFQEVSEKNKYPRAADDLIGNEFYWGTRKCLIHHFDTYEMKFDIHDAMTGQHLVDISLENLIGRVMQSAEILNTAITEEYPEYFI